MSWTRYYEIACDECGDSHPNMEWTLTEIRRQARKDGWLSTTERDLCPKCRAGDSKSNA